MFNPYLDYFTALPSGCRRDPAVPIVPWGESDAGWLNFKNAVARHFAWAVPTRPAIDTIAAVTERVVEVGAGSGYWAWLMAQVGIDVVAYDVAPPPVVWHPVWPSSELAVVWHSDRALFLCWPPAASEMAANALAAYTGDVVIYVGEWRGGSANDRFFTSLGSTFEEVDSVDLPQWRMRTDRLSIHRRR